MWFGRKKWKLPNIFNNIYLAAPIIFFSSLVFGIIFYMIVNEWEFRVAYYFASTVLLGNMYLVPTEPNIYSQVFTEFYFLWGTTMIAGAIAATVNEIVSNASRVAAEERHKMVSLLEHESPDNTDDDEGNGGAVSKKVRLRLAKETDPLDRRLYVAHRFYHKILRRLGLTSQVLSMKYLLFVAWMAVGTVYGMAYEKWSLGYAIFFALAAMSGSGACPPDCINDPPGGDMALCDIGVVRSYFFGSYILFGVPIFAYTAGQFAELLVKKAVQLNERKLMLRPLNVQEFQYALELQRGNLPRGLDSADDCSADDLALSATFSAKSRSRRSTSFALPPPTMTHYDSGTGSGNVHIEFDGFVLLELLRLQKITRHDLEYMKILFDNLKNPFTGAISLRAPGATAGGGGLGGGSRRPSVSRAASLAPGEGHAGGHAGGLLYEVPDSFTPMAGGGGGGAGGGGEAHYVAPAGLHTIYEEAGPGDGGGGAGSLEDTSDLVALTAQAIRQHQQSLLLQLHQQPPSHTSQEMEGPGTGTRTETGEEAGPGLSSSLELMKLWRYQDSDSVLPSSLTGNTGNTVAPDPPPPTPSGVLDSLSTKSMAGSCPGRGSSRAPPPGPGPDHPAPEDDCLPVDEDGDTAESGSLAESEDDGEVRRFLRQRGQTRKYATAASPFASSSAKPRTRQPYLKPFRSPSDRYLPLFSPLRRIPSPSPPSPAPAPGPTPDDSHQFPFLRAFFGLTDTEGDGDGEGDRGDEGEDEEVLGVYNQLVLPVLHSVQQKSEEVVQRPPDRAPSPSPPASPPGPGPWDDEEVVEGVSDVESGGAENYNYGKAYGRAYGTWRHSPRDSPRSRGPAEEDPDTNTETETERTPLIVLPHRASDASAAHLQRLHQQRIPWSGPEG